MKLWYDQPGEAMFDKTLPLGSGILGAMIFPGVREERIALNHAWLWRRYKTVGMKNPECAHWLKHIRKLFFEGRMEEAGELANRTLGSQARSRMPFYSAGADPTAGVYGPDPFVPAGDLTIRFAGDDRGDFFRSALELSTAEATVEVGNGAKQIKQQAFVSRPRDVLLVRFASQTAMDGTLSFSRVPDPDCVLEDRSEGDQALCTLGTLAEGRTFAMRAHVTAEEGTVTLSNGVCHFQGVRTLTLAVAVATDHEGPDPVAVCKKLLADIDSDSFAALRREAIDAHSTLFDRVQFEICAPERIDLPTDQRLARFSAGEEDPELQTLMLQMHRYLVIAYSKVGGVPGNLRGIWSDEVVPNWCCDIHNDINAQGNYFSVDPLAVPETADVLFDFLESLLPAAREAARKIYGCRGIFIPLTSSCWPECFKVEPGWDEMVSVAAWYSQHYWWRWEYERDEKFLRERCYPFLREAALFYLDYLVPDPRKGHPNYGKLQAVPSYSPENAFIGGNKPVSLSISSSFELELIQQLFESALEAAKILGEPEAVQAEYQYVLDNLAPLPVDREGTLQEWSEDYPQNANNGRPNDDPGYGHRHLSPVVGVFPGDVISPAKTPALAQAAYQTIKRRIRYGGCKGGWGAWSAAILTRLGHPEEAQERIRVYTGDDRRGGTRVLAPNGGLFSCVASAELEMVLQSHDGCIRLLPALPKGWENGRASGLRARGGFEVSLRWQEGRLSAVEILSRRGGVCTVAVGETRRTFDTREGQRYTLNGQLMPVEQA